MNKNNDNFLPTSVKELKNLGWDSLDVIIFSGDAYVDHPSFGNALIARYLESLGLKVAIVPQPNWRDDLRDFKKLGKPKYFFAVSAGNMDSMINHYTPQKRLRSDDAYTAGGIAGQRPDYPSIVYTKILKQLYPDVPVILGGIEASLRRLTHYDYWHDSLKPSILYESGADFLVYGMAEQALKEIVKVFVTGGDEKRLKEIPQIAYIHHNDKIFECCEKFIELPSYQSCKKDKKNFATSFVTIETEINKSKPCILIQKVFDKTVVVNPPFEPISEEELDGIYGLPFTRKPHYRYKSTIPAYTMIKDSVTIHRGCFGGCSFCTLAAHQSKFISSRSKDSIMAELKKIVSMDNFKGQISDLGGPSANMYKMTVFDTGLCLLCKRNTCLFPKLCNNINNNHKELIDLYKEASALKGVKRISIGSGIRYDLLTSHNRDVQQSCDDYLEQLMKYHVSGRLKVAPEHTSDTVLKVMQKPSFVSFLAFMKKFEAINKKYHLNLHLIPYFISSHPGTTYSDMCELAITAKTYKLNTEHVQDFTPTPMTLSSVIYYSGINPYTNEKIYVSKELKEKQEQKKFFFYYLKENRESIKKIMEKIKRKDLLLRLYK